MGLTSALNTALNGLTLNETSIDVLGNNIANAGTNGFKSSNVLFMSQLARTLSVGSRPTSTNGGTNPRQIGLGASTAAILKDFTQGSVTNSTSPSDLAIQGEGFFVLEGNEGQVYSRAGNFRLNSANLLVDPQGLRVQGYGVDDQFNLVTTTLTDITIPLGELNVAQRTQNISLDGALLPTGEAGTQGSILDSATIQVASGTLTTATLLSDVLDGGAANLFTVGETLSLAPRKGARTLDPVTLDVTTTSTVADLLALYEDALGLHTGGTVPDVSDGAGGTVAVGASLDATGTTGTIQIVGNAGTVHEIDVATGDLTSDGTSVPLTFTKNLNANGESTITDFVVYDSLGEELTVKMTAVLEEKNSSTTVFRWYLDSYDDSRSDTAIGNGTITFDSEGNVIGGATNTFSIQRDNTAAVSPMQITADFSAISGISSATAGSTLSLNSQDGSDPGTLTSFVIDESGVINGVFDNGIIRTLGQAVLARFSNTQGLVEAGATAYKEGVSSGPPQIVQPGEFGVGTIRAGAIELSNTDIGRNLVELIVASTNYRGNARVISSVQELVDELLVLGR
ncbi:flagellar hook-basal body complex protein [Calycomorphotria hydatis]|uniref:Flagellar hook protein FlgE n=1 Tax=Calycomorphotria hydatis TaxID=2528027 RepID=A0A517TB93_9PLAN|nr:flagellar hook-basal body complex protein [Calycomorphotria hydatis]QDT65643.1 Flagellar hook protein FlgE [Calycomorphotria hydatis]